MTFKGLGRLFKPTSARFSVGERVRPYFDLPDAFLCQPEPFGGFGPCVGLPHIPDLGVTPLKASLFVVAYWHVRMIHRRNIIANDL